jgi:hypothetical protein
VLSLLLASILLDDSARLQAVLSLRAARTPQNYQVLSEAMNADLSDKVRLAAAEGVLLYEGVPPLEAVDAFLREERGEYVRESLCVFLSSAALHADSPQATALLASRLGEDPSPKVRLAAVAALEARGDRRALKDLLLAMQGDDDPAVRARAGRAHKLLSKPPKPLLKKEPQADETEEASPPEPRQGVDPCLGGKGWCQCFSPPITLPARCQALDDCQSRYDAFYRRNGYRCSWDGRPLE